ncbi:MAG: RNase adapter RapZ [Proteobacteria bacterium]|nr:RNase adapter RapZ [Pseudomonadota bacterium]
MTDPIAVSNERKQPGNNKGNGPARLLLITGMSGAGKSTTLKALEDLGYEAVDNLPLSLVGNLVGLPGQDLGPLAIGVDIRTRDFGIDLFSQQLDALLARPDLKVDLVFLDCDDEVLRQRYTETRRRHPMYERPRDTDGSTPERRVSDAVAHERNLVTPLRDRADLVIDTSNLTLNEFRRVLVGHFGNVAESSFSVSVVSFSYRRGIPREADLVFDVRFLSNPFYEKDLRALTGLDKDVGEFIAADPDFATFYGSLIQLIEPLFPRFRAEGKSYLTIAVGCTGGQHRSVYVAERLYAWLLSRGESVTISHREIQGSLGKHLPAAC